MSRHGFEVWNTLVHVPLMIAAPGATARHVDVPRSDVDLAPTILEIFGLPAAADLRGRPRSSRRSTARTSEPRDIVVDLPATSDNGKRRALVHGSQKIICFDSDTLLQAVRSRQGSARKGPDDARRRVQGNEGTHDRTREGHQGGPAVRVHGGLHQQQPATHAAAAAAAGELSHANRPGPVPEGQLRVPRRSRRSGDAVIVDASEAAPVREALAREGARARAIWSTHHHWDHVGRQRGAGEGTRHRGRRTRFGRRAASRALAQGRYGGQGARRGRRGALHPHPGAHARGRRVLRGGGRRAGRLHGRHALLRRLRAALRGHACADARLARAPARATGRHARSLRPRVHREQPALRGAHRAARTST